MKAFWTILAVGTALAAGSCSRLAKEQGCDSPAIQAAVKGLIAGTKADQTDQETSTWLSQVLKITVLNQKRDETRLHLSCTAQLDVAGEVNQKAGGLLSIYAAMGKAEGAEVSHIIFHYLASLDPESGNATIVVAPDDEHEQSVIGFAKMRLQAALRSRTASRSAKEQQDDSASKSEASDIGSTLSGKYQRHAPSLSDLEIVPEGNQWRVKIAGAGLPRGEQTAGDCHIQAVGPLVGHQIVARLVPFSEDDFEVTSDEAKAIKDNTVVEIAQDEVTVTQAPIDDICGVGSDLTGKYTRTARQ